MPDYHRFTVWQSIKLGFGFAIGWFLFFLILAVLAATVTLIIFAAAGQPGGDGTFSWPTPIPGSSP